MYKTPNTHQQQTKTNFHLVSQSQAVLGGGLSRQSRSGEMSPQPFVALINQKHPQKQDQNSKQVVSKQTQSNIFESLGKHVVKEEPSEHKIERKDEDSRTGVYVSPGFPNRSVHVSGKQSKIGSSRHIVINQTQNNPIVSTSTDNNLTNPNLNSLRDLLQDFNSKESVLATKDKPLVVSPLFNSKLKDQKPLISFPPAPAFPKGVLPTGYETPTNEYSIKRVFRRDEVSEDEDGYKSLHQKAKEKIKQEDKDEPIAISLIKQKPVTQREPEQHLWKRQEERKDRKDLPVIQGVSNIKAIGSEKERQRKGGDQERERER